MVKENFKKYEGKTYEDLRRDAFSINGTIVDIAIELKNQLARLSAMSRQKPELRNDLWMDIKNLSKCINDLVDENIVTLDEKELKIINVKSIS